MSWPIPSRTSKSVRHLDGRHRLRISGLTGNLHGPFQEREKWLSLQEESRCSALQFPC